MSNNVSNWHLREPVADNPITFFGVPIEPSGRRTFVQATNHHEPNTLDQDFPVRCHRSTAPHTVVQRRTPLWSISRRFVLPYQSGTHQFLTMQISLSVDQPSGV
jgi:hypothetical protein